MATADEIQSNAQTAINQLLTTIAPLFDELKTYAQSQAQVPDIDISTVEVDRSDTDAVAAAAANTIGPTFTMSAGFDAPVRPGISSFAFPTIGAAPDLDLAAPILNLPTRPDGLNLTAPGDAPDFNTPIIPDAPTVTLPDVPTITNVALPDAPELVMPLFTGVEPTDDTLVPTNDFHYTEAEYQSDLLDPLKQKLLNDLLNGGYGIEPQDESGLWERARERELRGADTAIQEAARQAAARGLMLPPGVLHMQIAAAQQAALEKIATAERDIALKRADMYVENRKFTIQQTKEVEDMLQKYWGFAQERALNAAKYTAEFSIHVFNASVERYKARMEAFKAQAAVFESLTRAALANLEAYKAKLEGARIALDIQKIHVEVYSKQLEGAMALVGIYKTQMEAAAIAASVEKLRLDAFRAKVEAYTAQVGAKSAEFQMYRAGIEGETAKVNIFEAQVRAYGSQVSAYAAKVGAAEAEVRSRTMVAGLSIDAYKADIEAYRSRLLAAQTDIQAAAQKYTNDIALYRATVDAQGTAANARTGVAKANADIALAKAGTLSHHILGQASAVNAHAVMATSASKDAITALAGALNGFASAAAGIAAQITTASA